jgi:hypothetical protein
LLNIHLIFIFNPKFGVDIYLILVVIGDQSDKLNEYLTIYNIYEFRTSCLNYKTEERCENMYLSDIKGVKRKIHSILRYQTESKRIECINSDKNAVNNMIKIVNIYLLNKIQSEKFRRDFKFPDKIKITKDDTYDAPLWKVSAPKVTTLLLLILIIASNVIKPK